MKKYIFNVKPIEESVLEVEGESVKIIVFEDTKEGEIVKICTENHSLGVSAEYVWIENKHPEYDMGRQTLTDMKLNGQNVKCDVLTIECEGETINVFFDISDFYDNDAF